VTNYKKSR